MTRRGWVSSPIYRTMIEFIASAREESGISQRELARRVGKPPSFINKIELLERRIDLLEFIAIAEALGRKPDELVQGLREALPPTLSLY